jgi:hypothetical protein
MKNKKKLIATLKTTSILLAGISTVLKNSSTLIMKVATSLEKSPQDKNFFQLLKTVFFHKLPHSFRFFAKHTL